MLSRTTIAHHEPVHLIDIGANLTHDSFDHDRDAVLARARAAGVAQMVVTGASREHSPPTRRLLGRGERRRANRGPLRRLR